MLCEAVNKARHIVRFHFVDPNQGEWFKGRSNTIWHPRRSDCRTQTNRRKRSEPACEMEIEPCAICRRQIPETQSVGGIGSHICKDLANRREVDASDAGRRYMHACISRMMEGGAERRASMISNGVPWRSGARFEVAVDKSIRPNSRNRA